MLVLAAVALSAVLAWLSLSNAHLWRPRARDARVQSEVRAVDAFHKIDLDGAADVVLVQGAETSLRIETSADAPVATHVRNGTLRIDAGYARRGLRGLFARGSRASPKITITFRDLTDIEASGAVKVRAAALRTPSLHVDMSGAGALDLAGLQTEMLFVEGAGTIKANIAGRATRQRVEISGAGNYQAAELASDSARIDVSGAGNVVVNVAKALRVDISGAGAVSYTGNPAVQKSISGMGRVRQLAERREVRVDAPDPAPQSPHEHTGHRLIA
ncbi:MAG: head GIN domain-containing protein [Casimicrobiaceae bacterium]